MIFRDIAYIKHLLISQVSLDLLSVVPAVVHVDGLSQDPLSLILLRFSESDLGFLDQDLDHREIPRHAGPHQGGGLCLLLLNLEQIFEAELQKATDRLLILELNEVESCAQFHWPGLKHRNLFMEYGFLQGHRVE